MKRFVGGLLLLSLALQLMAFSYVGHHGHFVLFRPWMAEDWLIWGPAASCLVIGIYLLATTHYPLMHRRDDSI